MSSGRGRFAEVWKGNLSQDENPQVVSVKVFQLRNYGAWRQEKDMLTEGWVVLSLFCRNREQVHNLFIFIFTKCGFELCRFLDLILIAYVS